MSTVRYHQVSPLMFPFSFDIYDYADGTPLSHIDVHNPGGVSVPGYGRPVCVVVTYWRLGKVLVMGPPPVPADPTSEPCSWEFPTEHVRGRNG